MIDLPQVTALAVHTSQSAVAVRALRYSMRQINFGAVKLCAIVPPYNIGADIQFCPIEPFNSYSDFAIHSLKNFVDTEYLLVVQTDGFVINPQRWSQDFLNYDYIGAPWPPDAPWVNGNENQRVGNGGFSLRSRKLLQTPNIYAGGHEDIALACSNRKYLEDIGIRFAPVSVAMHFSLEMNIPELGAKTGFHNWTPADPLDSFGFHNRSIYPEKLKLLEDASLDVPNR